MIWVILGLYLGYSWIIPDLLNNIIRRNTEYAAIKGKIRR